MATESQEYWRKAQDHAQTSTDYAQKAVLLRGEAKRDCLKKAEAHRQQSNAYVTTAKELERRGR